MSEQAVTSPACRLSVPPEDPFGPLADALLKVAGGPTGVTTHIVVLPHAGLIAPAAQALRVRVGGPCPLPQLLSLQDWLAQQPVPPVTLSEAQLVAELHRQLAARPWLAGIDHWAMAAELATLFDALGRGCQGFPQTAEDLAALLGQAYETQTSALLRLDAQLVHQLWYACEGRPEWGLSPWQRDALAMAHLLQMPASPLWVFDAGRATPQADAFYARYAERAKVTRVQLEAAAGARSAWVHAACTGGATAFAERARDMAAAMSAPPQGIRVHRALGREGEVLHVCDTVCEWLAEGLECIAVVATDRALARRLRALLERRGVLAEDNAGWSLATTRVGAAVRDLMRLQSRPTAALLLACIDSPLVAAAARLQYLAGLGPALAALPPHALLNWDALADDPSLTPEAAGWLQHTRRCLQAAGARARPLAQWIDGLLQTLGELAPELPLDPAGRQLTAYLQRSAQALGQDLAPRSRRDFAGWLDWALERALFRDASVQSPVLLTHPSALRGMCFGALIVVGAVAANLPALGNRPRVVRDAARAELGLPDAAARRAWAVDDWCLLMGSAPRVDISWQILDDRGEPEAASPLLQLMQGFHQLAWGRPLPQATPFQPVDAHFAMALQPAERAVMEALPAALSATAYQTLLDCPYRWFVRQGLGLEAPREVVESLEPREFGNAVHAVLYRLHQRLPVLSAVGRADALAQMETVTDAVFAPMLARDFSAAGWRARWDAVASAYIDWQLAREADGWRVAVAACEQPVERALPQPATAITVRGKPDRVDVRADGASGPFVIDYKTGSRAALEARLRDLSEDGQLVLYAHLIAGAEGVAYLPLGNDALEKGGLEPVGVSDLELREATAGHLERLAATLARIAAGEPLRAIGDEVACRHCHARGICRRDHRAAVDTVDSVAIAASGTA